MLVGRRIGDASESSTETRSTRENVVEKWRSEYSEFGNKYVQTAVTKLTSIFFFCKLLELWRIHVDPSQNELLHKCTRNPSCTRYVVMCVYVRGPAGAHEKSLHARRFIADGYGRLLPGGRSKPSFRAHTPVV